MRCGRKKGLLQIANGGTVFLDEIGEMPVDLQSNCFRASRSARFVRWEHEGIPIDVRILAATNRDLEQTWRKEISAGT